MSNQARTSAQSVSRSFTRRHVVGAAASVFAGLVLFPSAYAQGSSPNASPAVANGEWTFTDDKGVTVTLPSRPERIVADVNAAASLWDFGIRPVAVFGWNATENGDFGPAGGNIDPGAVAIVGNATEPIQPEAVAAQHPDLLVTLTFTLDDATEYWSIESSILPQVTPIAPIVAISGTGMADADTERFAELAAALGADLDSPELKEAKATYDAALTSLKETASATSGLRILFAYVDATDEAYVASPQDFAELSLYTHLGLQLVQPDVAKNEYWETLSAEQALKYPADVLFYSARPGTLTADQFKAHPTWGQHPAVKAGQIAAWNQDVIMSYQGMTEALNATIAPLLTAVKVT
ncbi:MAG TPA: ABC transporter substrate-binding protein [Thermomicrobiales bacterium]|nr:ABC transporter substrate-binding protein [Thermomicrobiales bacterium]